MTPDQGDGFIANAFARKTDTLNSEREKLVGRLEKLAKILSPSSAAFAAKMIAQAEAADGDMRTLPHETERLNGELADLLAQVGKLPTEEKEAFDALANIERKIVNIEYQLMPDNVEHN